MKQAILPGDLYKVERLKNYIHYGQVKVFSKGSTIFMAGDTLEALILVISGKAKVVILKEDGTELLFYTAQADQMMSRLYDKNDSILHCYAMEDTVLCLFRQEQLKKVFAEDDEMVFDLLRNYTSKVSYFKNMLTIVNSASSSHKIYSLLILLCRNIYLDKHPSSREGDFDLQQEYIVDLEMSQKLLAEVIGVHPVTVSKVLNQLAKDEVISKNGKIITVKKPAKLIDFLKETEAHIEELKID